MNNNRIVAGMALVLLLASGAVACSSSNPVRIREPLALPSTAPPTAQQYTEQGSNAYVAGEFEQAKSFFQRAVSLAPQSGEARYNLGLAFFKLREEDAAREQFMKAANLAPGNKVIWDSPALSPYGSPEPNIQQKPIDPYDKSRRGRSGGLGGLGGIGR